MSKQQENKQEFINIVSSPEEHNAFVKKLIEQDPSTEVQDALVKEFVDTHPTTITNETLQETAKLIKDIKLPYTNTEKF